MSRTIIFWDIDGTLIDSSGAGGGALAEALKDEFGVLDPPRVSLQGRTDLGIFCELLTASDQEATPENLRRLTQNYFGRLGTVLKQRGGRILPGVVELLKLLDGREECTQSIATGNMPGSALAKLKHYGLEGYFSYGVFGHGAIDRLDLTRPLAEAAQHLQTPENARVPIHQHVESIQITFTPDAASAGDGGSHDKRPFPERNFAPKDILIIGDTPLDVALAKSVGARSLAVETGGFTRQDLEQAGADRVVNSLESTQELASFILAST